MKDNFWRSECPLTFFLAPNTTFSQLHSLSPDCSTSGDCFFSFHNPLQPSVSPPLNFFLRPELRASLDSHSFLISYSKVLNKILEHLEAPADLRQLTHCTSIPQAALNTEVYMCVMRNGTQWLLQIWELLLFHYHILFISDQKAETLMNFVPTEMYYIRNFTHCLSNSPEKKQVYSLLRHDEEELRNCLQNRVVFKGF